MDFDGAVDALVAANTETPAPVVEAPAAAPEQAGTPPDSSTTVDTGATPLEADSFTEIDLNSLPPEVRALVEEKFGQFQADYTRKTQAAAPWRKLGEEMGISPEEAREALAAVQALQSDEDAQRQLFEALSQRFGNPDGTDTDDVTSEFTDPRDQQIQELVAWKEQFEQEQLRSQAQAEYDRSVSEILRDNPSYQDSDIEYITRLAVASGDMREAAESYAALRQSVLGAAFKEKGTSVPGQGPLPTGGHAQTPTKFESLDDADKAARLLLEADLAN